MGHALPRASRDKIYMVEAAGSYICAMHDAITTLCLEAIEDRLFSGCVVGLRRPGGASETLSFGMDDYLVDGKPETLAQARPIEPDTIFDIASLTKVVPTATLALKRILAGTLDPDQPVIGILPELATPFREKVLVRHLLTHTLDYRFPMSSLKDLPAAHVLERILTHPFTAEPGTLFNYGNAASVVLGLVLQRLGNASLQELGQREFFAPLGMVNSGWNLRERFAPERFAPTEDCPWRGRVLRGEVHDESAFAMQALGPAGSAGMFSTVPDLLRFIDMLLGDGVWQGQRLMPAGFLDLVTRNAIGHLQGQCTGLGWELANRRFMGEVAGPRTFGKTGFTGCSLTIDPDRNAGLVLLSNFTWPRREPTVERIFAFRRRLADLYFKG